MSTKPNTKHSIIFAADESVSGEDISRPLKHSFIHTGHGSIDPDQCWGNPEFIDE